MGSLHGLGYSKQQYNQDVSKTIKHDSLMTAADECGNRSWHLIRSHLFGNAVKSPIPSYRSTMAQTLFRWFYSFVLVLVIPFAFINLVRRGVLRTRDYNRRRFERFGFVAPPPATGGYLFHCVSVGEVVAASCLIKKIMQQEPNTQITVTTTTPTGSARVRAIFGNQVHHFYLPYDLHMAMAGMLRRVKPKAVLITEVELWPNLIHVCWRKCIPVMVINARMTDRSARRYKKVGILFEPMLGKLSHVCAQGQRDYDNYRFLGMPSDRLSLTNNIKFDQAANAKPAAMPFMHLNNARPVLVAGSTHDPEEKVLLSVLHRLLPEFPDVLLILVPRHPERFAAVEKMLAEAGVHYVCSEAAGQVPAHCQVVLLNEMGRLNEAYQVANIAFVGGSLADRGGHNALEPAAVAVPVIMGPHTYNNPVICAYLEQCGALTLVNSDEDMATLCRTWLTDPEVAKKAGLAGRQVLEDNRGALQKTWNEIQRICR